MKLGQLTEYSMRYSFVEKSNTKCCGEAIPRPSGSMILKFYTVCFCRMLI